MLLLNNMHLSVFVAAVCCIVLFPSLSAASILLGNDLVTIPTNESIVVNSNSICLYDSLRVGWKQMCANCRVGIWSESNPNSNVVLIDACSKVLSGQQNGRLHHDAWQQLKHEQCSTTDIYSASQLDSKSDRHSDIVSSESTAPYLRCGMNEDHCVPVVDKISLLNSELILEFADSQQLQFQNLRNLSTTAALLDVFSFVPPLVPAKRSFDTNISDGAQFYGRWSSADIDEGVSSSPSDASEKTTELKLIVSSVDGKSHLAYIQSVYAAHSSGSPISITPLLPPSHAKYNASNPLTCRDYAAKRVAECACYSVAVRMLQYGDFTVGLVNAETQEVVSLVQRVSVTACDDEVLVWASTGSSSDTHRGGDNEEVSTSEASTTNSAESRVVITEGATNSMIKLQSDGENGQDAGAGSVVVPAVVWGGILSMTGSSSMFQIPYDITPGLVTGSWSIGFHIRLLAEPTGEMRTLFYKGDYSGRYPNRTPSVWLLPNSNRLSVRVSSIANHDVGVDTTVPLSTQQWSYVVFSFTNHTHIYQQQLVEFARKYNISMGSTSTNAISASSGATAPCCGSDNATIDTICAADNHTSSCSCGNATESNLSEEQSRTETEHVENNERVEHDSPKAVDWFASWRDHPDFPVSPAASASMTVYIDGKTDISVSYKDPLVGNTHPLYMFKDISHSGPVGFVQDLTVYEGPLSEAEVARLYRASSGRIDTAVGSNDGKRSHAKSSDHHSKGKNGNTPKAASNYAVGRDAVERGLSFLEHSVWFQQHQLCGSSNSSSNSNSYSRRNTVTDEYTSSSADWDYDSELRQEEKQTAASLLTQMQETHAASCRYSPAERKEIYFDLVESWSSIDALRLYGLVEGFGSEGPQNQCGLGGGGGGGGDSGRFASVSTGRPFQPSNSNNPSELTGSYLTVHAGSPALSPLKSLMSLLVALEFGSDEALVPFSTMLLSSVGVSEWLELLSMFPDLYQHDNKSDSDIDKQKLKQQFNVYHDILLSLIPLSDDMAQWLRHSAVESFAKSAVDDDTLTGSTRNRSGSGGTLIVKMHHLLVGLLQPPSTGNLEDVISNDNFRHLPTATSALCWRYNCDVTNGGYSSSNSDGVTNLALGLLHVAAVVDNHEAQRILSHRYKHGLTVAPNVEVSAQYGILAATIALEEFHKVGLTPIVEKDRIDETTDDHIDQGNTGHDDALIQAQILRAEAGDIAALMATGDLYYYGARGLPRDQPRALDYFTRAEGLGSTEAKCAMANMYLKGEGTTPANTKNVTRAIALYEEAAALGSIRGLNGLGYIYFYGQEVPKNETKAFGYFLAAAETETDQDSLFNTAHCLEYGIGTPKDVARAVSFYTTAAQKFGNFGAVKALGVLYLHGNGVARSATTALNYLTAAGYSGPWGMWIRRGLDNYLVGDYHRALLCYAHGGELGYEVAVANAAYILKKKLISNSHASTALVFSDFSGRNSGQGGVIDAFRQLLAVGTSLLPSDMFSIDDYQYQRMNQQFEAQQLQQIQALQSSKHDHLNYYGSLYIRELIVSSVYDNTDSMVKLGHVFVDGLSKLGIQQWSGYHYIGDSNVKAAIYWYSRSAMSHHALSNLYLGAIYQFHCVSGCVGTPENMPHSDILANVSADSAGSRSPVGNNLAIGNIARARQYYKAALDNPTLPGGFQVIARGLLWLTDQLLDLKYATRQVDASTTWRVPGSVVEGEDKEILLSAGTQRTTRISKTLSSILRHNAEKMGITIRDDGFVLVSDILQQRDLRRLDTTLEDITQVVSSSDKQRFELSELERSANVTTKALYIRAVQGHSMKCVQADSGLLHELTLDEVSTASPGTFASTNSEYQVVIHGTRLEYVDSIMTGRSTGTNPAGKTAIPGLSRCKRNHVHLSLGFPEGFNINRWSSKIHQYRPTAAGGSGKVDRDAVVPPSTVFQSLIGDVHQQTVSRSRSGGSGSSTTAGPAPAIPIAVSGIRYSTTAILFIDIRRAMLDGIKFYRSNNDVILTAGFGDTGILPAKYISDVITRD